MNIGDGHAVGGLFERIEHAYQEGKLNEAGGEVAATEAPAAARPLGADEPAGAASVAAPDANGWEHLENPVQRGLLKICSQAIDGGYASEDDLRDSVVEAIVELRYGGPLLEGHSAQIMHTLRATLSTDPNFRQGVEHLLLLAARELA